jgi:hypothetical protein
VEEDATIQYATQLIPTLQYFGLSKYFATPVFQRVTKIFKRDNIPLELWLTWCNDHVRLLNR